MAQHLSGAIPQNYVVADGYCLSEAEIAVDDKWQIDQGPLLFILSLVGSPVLYGLEDLVLVVETKVFEKEARDLGPSAKPEVADYNWGFWHSLRHFFALHQIIRTGFSNLILLIILYDGVSRL